MHQRQSKPWNSYWIVLLQEIDLEGEVGWGWAAPPTRREEKGMGKCGKMCQAGLAATAHSRRQGNKGWCLMPGLGGALLPPLPSTRHQPTHQIETKQLGKAPVILNLGRGELQMFGVFFFVGFSKQLLALPMGKSIINRSMLISCATEVWFLTLPVREKNKAIWFHRTTLTEMAAGSLSSYHWFISSTKYFWQDKSPFELI